MAFGARLNQVIPYEMRKRAGGLERRGYGASVGMTGQVRARGSDDGSATPTAAKELRRPWLDRHVAGRTLCS